MASPPFNINQAIPGDTDIVSQHPANARTFRDVVESWLLINHNVNGRHDKVDYDTVSTPSVPGTAVTWVDSVGDLRIKRSVGPSTNAQYVGPPPGTIVDYAGVTAPDGWLLCYGQAVSRTTYAALFAITGTNFGTGDGSTTFNLPDYRGRVGVGQDNMGGSTAGRITVAGSGIAGTTFAATGGAQNVTLTTSTMPNHSHTIAINDPGHSHAFTDDTFSASHQADTGAGAFAGTAGSAGDTTATATTGITATSSTEGSGGAHSNVQPIIIVSKIIRF